MFLNHLPDKFGMNKILIVTSRVTYVPENYANLFSELLRLREQDFEFKNTYTLKVVFLNNRSLILFLKAFFLIFTGAPRIGFHLFKNNMNSYLYDPRIKMLNSNGIKTYIFRTPNSIQFRNFLRLEKIDLLINARTRYIYKRKTLNTPKLGAFNIHHGILPENRGTMCDLWAMYNQKPLGFSIHQMNEKIDDGKIVIAYEHKDENITHLKNYTEYLRQSSTIEGRVLFQFIKNQYKNLELQGIDSISSPNIQKQNNPHTKNPTLKEIWKMKTKGLKL